MAIRELPAPPAAARPAPRTASASPAGPSSPRPSAAPACPGTPRSARCARSTSRPSPARSAPRATASRAAARCRPAATTSSSTSRLLAGVTDRGLRHPRNEDAMALATTETPAGPVAIAVVCDGVSSSPNPDDASLTGAQAAVRMLLTSIRRGDDPDEASIAAVRQAHEAMAILGSPSRAPSATYISAIVGPDAVTICWLGDSRAYWLATESEPARLTRDDSLAEEMVAQGEMTEARGHGLTAGTRDHPLARRRRGRAAAARRAVRAARTWDRARLLRRAVELPARGGRPGGARAPDRVPRPVQRRRRAAEVRPGRGRHGQRHRRAGPVPARAARAVTKENPP